MQVWMAGLREHQSVLMLCLLGTVSIGKSSLSPLVLGPAWLSWTRSVQLSTHYSTHQPPLLPPSHQLHCLPSPPIHPSSTHLPCFTPSSPIHSPIGIPPPPPLFTYPPIHSPPATLPPSHPPKVP